MPKHNPTHLLPKFPTSAVASATPPPPSPKKQEIKKLQLLLHLTSYTRETILATSLKSTKAPNGWGKEQESGATNHASWWLM